MAQSRHYSPQLSRFIVSVLYHQAKHCKVPMTKLTDELLQNALRGTPGWIQATTLKLAEDQEIPVLSKTA